MNWARNRPVLNVCQPLISHSIMQKLHTYYQWCVKLNLSILLTLFVCVAQWQQGGPTPQGGGSVSGRAHPRRGDRAPCDFCMAEFWEGPPPKQEKGVPRFTLYCLIQTVMVRLLETGSYEDN